jgi:beta-glucosidase
LQYYGPDTKRLVEPGEFEVQAGRNSMDYISDKFEIKTPLK